MSHKYQQTVEQANDYLWLVLSLLGRYGLAPNPINFSVWYEYVANTNISLQQTIDSLLAVQDTLTDAEMRQIYQTFIQQEDSAVVLQDELERMRVESHTDALTSLPNRRAFEQAFYQAVHNKSFVQQALCLLVLDIDHFKKINDSHGHLFGDKVLRQVADILKAQIKGQDVCARIGGEEFVILLPNTTYSGALQLAENIRYAIQHHTFRKTVTDEIVTGVTVSIGAALYRHPESLESFFDRGDQALYQAKVKGRNQVSSEY